MKKNEGEVLCKWTGGSEVWPADLSLEEMHRRYRAARMAHGEVILMLHQSRPTFMARVKGFFTNGLEGEL